MLKHYQTHGLRLGTRGSPLALWQAKHAAARIKRKFGIECEIVKILTYADTHKGSLQNLQHKGVFVSAIQKELSDGTIHAAVHSLKDLPAAESSSIAAHLPLASRTDLLCTQPGFSLANLPHAAKVGTGSIRRKMQLLQKRPDLTVLDIRGNVGTRLKAVEDGLVDAVILAKAGLVRLGILPQTAPLDAANMATAATAENAGTPITGFNLAAHELPERDFPTAAGQGCIALEALDPNIYRILQELDDPHTHILMYAERKVLQLLGCGCTAPVAVCADWLPGGLCIQVWVYKKHGGFLFERSDIAISQHELNADPQPASYYPRIQSAAIMLVDRLNLKSAAKYIDEYR